MLTVFGIQITLPPGWQFLANVYGSFVATVLAWCVIALLVYLVFTYLLRWVTRRLPGEIDDIILGIVAQPLLLLVIAFGVVNSLSVLSLPTALNDVLEQLFNTVLILIAAWLFWRVLKD